MTPCNFYLVMEGDINMSSSSISQGEKKLILLTAQV